jgi:hypothetical protein
LKKEEKMKRIGKYGLAGGMLVLALLVLTSCTSSIERGYTPGGHKEKEVVTENGKVISLLEREFAQTRIEGKGIFENANEGLARRTAIKLAVEDLAGQVQTKIKSNSTIYNNQDVRDVVESNVLALVNNYRIESEGYDQGTKVYRVTVSITGEKIVNEFRKCIR